MNSEDTQIDEQCSCEGIQEEHILGVYCAWCSDFLYNIKLPKRISYKASHGICTKCIEKYFKDKCGI